MHRMLLKSKPNAINTHCIVIGFPKVYVITIYIIQLKTGMPYNRSISKESSILTNDGTVTAVLPSFPCYCSIDF